MALTTYLLRDIDRKLWKKVKARAAREGRSIRGLLLVWLTAYVNGEKDQ